MSIKEKINKQTIVVTPIQDLKPSTAFPDIYKKGERYLAEHHGPNTTKVYIPNGSYEYWTFFIGDMEGFFIDLEQQRNQKLNELGL